MRAALGALAHCASGKAAYMTQPMEWLHQLTFASDAEWLMLSGLACWLFAGVCLLAEHWRNHRRSVERLERVGWVPWTPLFLASAVIGGGLLAMSLPVVLGSL